MTPQPTQANLVQVIAAIICRDAGLTDSLARSFAETICDGLSREYPGETLYIPALPATDRAARNAAIRADFDKHGIRWVVNRYGLSRSAVYAILNKTETP